MKYSLGSSYPNTLEEIKNNPVLRGIPCRTETSQKVEGILNDIRVLKVKMILQKINEERKQKGKEAIEIKKTLLDSISRNMNDFEQTLNKFKKVKGDIYYFIERCYEYNQEAFNGNNPNNMNLKELLVMSKNGYKPLVENTEELEEKDRILREKFENQFTNIERIMLNNFGIGRDDGVFRKIFEVRFGVDYNYETSSDDILTRKTLYEIAEVGENAEVYPKELKFCRGEKGWPKYEVPFDLRYIDGESVKNKIFIAINRSNRNLYFRLRFNREVFYKLKQEFDQINSIITFYNGKVFINDGNKELEITDCLY